MVIAKIDATKNEEKSRDSPHSSSGTCVPQLQTAVSEHDGKAGSKLVLDYSGVHS